MLELLWFPGTGAAAWASSLPLLRVEFSAESVRERYPLRVGEPRCASRDLRGPRVEAARHGDDDAYFNAVLDLPGGRRVVVAESAGRAHSEQRREELLASVCAVCCGFSG